MRISNRTIRRCIIDLARDDEGATAIEYGLIIALIALAMIAALRGLGGQITSPFNTTSSTLSAANAAA